MSSVSDTGAITKDYADLEVRMFESYFCEVVRRGCSLLSRGAFNVSISTTYFLRCTSISRLHKLVKSKQIASPCLRVKKKDGLLFAGSCRNAVLRSHVKNMRIITRASSSVIIHIKTNII